MLDESLQNRQQLRLGRLAEVLRTFRLVDRWRLGELVRTGKNLSEQVITSRLRTFSEVLPPGISVEFLAQSIVSALGNYQDESLLDSSSADASAITSIPVGRRGAARYQQEVVKLLELVFSFDLVPMGKEVAQNQGRKRLDSAFRNGANSGFFADLPTKYGIPSAIIPVECKNYRSDLGNPELDQLGGRLTRKVGKLGILVCRSIGDSDRLSARLLDLADKEGKFLLVFTDDELIHLLKLWKRQALDGIDKYLHAKLAVLVLN